MITKFKDFLFESNDYVEQIERLLISGDIDLAKIMIDSIDEIDILAILNEKYNSLVEFIKKYREYSGRFEKDVNLFTIFEFEELSLENCKNVKELPNEFFNLTNLTYLTIDDNSISDFKGISKLNKLAYMNLGASNLKNIPTELTKLENLIELKIGNSSISSIPQTISNLQNLEVLTLSGADISDFTNICKCYNLECLEIVYSKIYEIPKNIKQLNKLRTLTLSSSLLTELPFELFELTNLKELNLMDNKKLSKIPDEIKNLKNLKTLNLEFTPFKKNYKELNRLKQLLPNTKIIDN